MEDLDKLLLQKEIYQILDGDEVLASSDGRELKMPYLSGPVLSEMAVEFGIPSSYSFGGAQSRWCYVEDMMGNAVETGRTSELLTMFFNNPKFADELKDVHADHFEAEHDRIVHLAVTAINKRLYFGGNELRQVGSEYSVVPRDATLKVAAPKLRVIDRKYVRMLSERAIADVDTWCQ